MSTRMYRRPKSGYSKPPKTKLNKVLQDVKKLKKAVPKANDPDIVVLQLDDTLDSTGSVNALDPGITQAPLDESNVRITRISGRILVTHNPAAVSPISFYSRIILIKDTQPAGAVPTVGDIMENTNVHGMLDVKTRRRFKILMDRTVRTSSVDQSGNVINFNKKVNIMQAYDASTPSVCTSNRFYLLILGDQAANGPDFKSYFEFHKFE